MAEGVEDLALLGVVIEERGVDPTISKLDTLAAKGTAAEKATTQLTQSQRELAAASVQTANATTQAATATASAASKLADAHADLVARMDRLVATSKTLDGANKTAASSLVTEAAGVRSLAEGTAQAALVQERFDKVLANLNANSRAAAQATETHTTANRYLTRDMALAQIAAQKMDDAITHGSKGHAEHVAGLTRITGALGSMVGHAIGVPPVVDRIGEVLGEFAIGATLTLGVTAGLAAIAIAYEKITASSQEAKKSAEAFRETDVGLAARARAQAQERDLTGKSAFGTSLLGSIDVVGTTKEITDAQRALRGFREELESGDTGNLGILRFGAVNQQLIALRREFGAGRITLDQYQHGLTELDRAFPGFEREILRSRELGNTFDEAAKAVGRLQAAEANAAAEARSLIAAHGQPGTSFATGGEAAVRLAESRKALEDAETRAQAATSGGALGVQAITDQREALDKATAKWKDYVIATGDATLAQTAYSDALGHHNAVAQQFLRESQAEIAANERTTRTLQLQAEVTRGTGEIDKQRALNAAFGESDLTLRELAIRYDAVNQKRQNALTHEKAERDQLDALTDSMAAQQTRAAELAAERARTDARRDTGISTDAAITSAEQEASLVGKTADEVARQRIEFAAINEQTAARVTLMKALERADADDAAAAYDIYDNTLLAIRARRDLAIANRDVATSTETSAMQQNREAIEAENAALASGAAQRKGYEIDLKAELELRKAIATIHDPGLLSARESEIEATRQAEQQHRILSESIEKMEARAKQVGHEVASVITSALDSLNKKGADFFQTWWDAGKRGLNKFIGDAVGQLASEKFGSVFGVGEGAAQAQLQAAGMMMIDSGRWSTAANGGVADAGTVFNPVGQSSGVGSALGYGAIALGGLSTGYGLGGAFYSQSHGALGNYARGAAGGAAAGALTGAAIGSVIPGIGTAVGAVAGAVTGFIGGILGVGSASKEAARQTRDLRQALADTMMGLRADVSHDSLAQSLAQTHAQYDQVRKQIEEAYSGGGANSDTVRERNKLLAETTELEKQRNEQLREEAAAMSRYFTEDLRVRELRAKGDTAAADALEFQNQQEKERDDYRRTHDMSQQANVDQYKYLVYVQSLEKNSDALKENTAALYTLRGQPSGFKLEPYLQEFGKAQPYPGQFQVPTPFVPPLSPLAPPMLTRTVNAAARAGAQAPYIDLRGSTFQFPNVVDGDKAADAFLKKLDRTKESTVGSNGTRAAALERMTLS